MHIFAYIITRISLKRGLLQLTIYRLPAPFELQVQVYSSDAWNNQADIYTMPTVGFELRLWCSLNSSA